MPVPSVSCRFCSVVAAVMFAARRIVIDAAPYESTMGLVQRIFYFHCPAAMTDAGHGDRLRHRERPVPRRGATPGADHVARGRGGTRGRVRPHRPRHGSALGAQGVGRLVGLGRAHHEHVRHVDGLRRLSAAAALRRAGSEVLAAAVGLFGMVLVPFVYWSVNIWRTMHPPTTVVPTLPADMGRPLYWCWAAFTILYVALMLVRVRLERSRDGSSTPIWCWRIDVTLRLSRMAATMIVAAMLSVTAMAAGLQGTGAAQDGFVAVPADQLGQEQLPAAPLVLAAYAFVWVRWSSTC